VLAVLAQFGKLLANVGGLRHHLAGNVENDVARFDAVLRGRPVGVDRRDRDALVSGAINFGGRCKGEAETRRRCRTAGAGLGAGLALIRQRAERERGGLLGTVAKDR